MNTRVRDLYELLASIERHLCTKKDAYIMEEKSSGALAMRMMLKHDLSMTSSAIQREFIFECVHCGNKWCLALTDIVHNLGSHHKSFFNSSSHSHLIRYLTHGSLPEEKSSQ